MLLERFIRATVSNNNGNRNKCFQSIEILPFNVKFFCNTEFLTDRELNTEKETEVVSISTLSIIAISQQPQTMHLHRLKFYNKYFTSTICCIINFVRASNSKQFFGYNVPPCWPETVNALCTNNRKRV